MIKKIKHNTKVYEQLYSGKDICYLQESSLPTIKIWKNIMVNFYIFLLHNFSVISPLKIIHDKHIMIHDMVYS